MHRRRFLEAMLTGAGSLVAAPRTLLAQSQPPAAPRNVRLASGTSAGGRQPFGPGDFTYLGAFSLPVTQIGDASYATGLTHRYVNGQCRLLSAYWGKSQLTEFAPPASLALKEPYQPGVVVRTWGADWHGSKLGGVIYGLFWDEIDGRLYWNANSEYTNAAHRTSFGYTRLNDSNGTTVTRGMFGFPNPPNYKAIKGMTAIPEGYRKRLGGKRIAAGFGGYESIVASGPASMGPTLAPFDHTALDGLDEGGDLPKSAVQVLLNHPFHNNAYRAPKRAIRNSYYRQTFDEWHPRDGVGYWTWPDNVRQSGVWIETASRQGLIVFVRQSTGNEQTTYSGIKPLGGLVYRLTLEAPLDNVRTDDIVNVPDTSNGDYAYVAARVQGFTRSDLTISLVTRPSNPAPVPPASGRVWRGAFYYGSTGWSTEGRLAAFVYDSEAMLAGAPPDEVRATAEFNWPIPTMPDPLPSWFDLGPGTVTGITYDSRTRRLYLLMQAAHPFGDRYPNSMVFVYEVA